MADIFISYASEDRQRIKPLVSELEATGYSIWWDQQLQGGSRFSKRIEEEITGAKVVLVVWSPRAILSRWVADEADLALETGNLLPISIDGARPPMGFRQLQTIDFADWAGAKADCLTTLKHALSGHLGGSQKHPQGVVSLPVSKDVKSDASIAVLPFVNMSSDPDQEYFADGIAEELLNLLAKIRELTVIARTSSFSFKGSEKKISEIGTILGVSYVLEGSIRKAGNRVRITAQLVETRGSSHLWSETYDRTLDDIFAIQDEISAAIVAELRSLILGGASMTAPISERTEKMAAYENYLLGQEHLNKRTNADIRAAEALYEKALSFDPDYTPALLGRAETLMLQTNVDGFYGNLPVRATCAKALPLIERALAIEPDMPEGLGMLSLYHRLMNNAAEAEKFARKALDLNPNYSRGFTLLAYALQASGDPAAPVFTTRKQALELDPVSALGLINVGAEYLNRLDFVNTATFMDRVNSLDPGSANARMGRLFTKLYRGDYVGALGMLMQPLIAFENQTNIFTTQIIATSLGHGEAVVSANPVGALRIFAERGFKESTKRLSAEIEAKGVSPGDYASAVALALAKNLEGDFAGALGLLEPFDQSGEKAWGPHFSLEHHCLGARAEIYAALRAGDETTASDLADKLKTFAEIRINDPEGIHYLAYFLKAVAAAAKGDLDAALSALETQINRTFYLSDAFLADPLLQTLVRHERFVRLREAVDAHFKDQKRLAEEKGLLPLNAAAAARLNTP